MGFEIVGEKLSFFDWQIDQEVNMSVFTVDIFGEDYSKCCGKKIWSVEKTPSAWTKGIINSANDREKAERIGYLGESAFGFVFNKPVDFSYVEGGDNGVDFAFGNSTIDVKTAKCHPVYDAGLVRARFKGVKLPLSSKIYVFAHVDHENQSANTARVTLLGFELRDDLKNRKEKPAKSKSPHMNYEVPYREMKSMHDFLKVCNKFSQNGVLT